MLGFFSLIFLSTLSHASLVWLCNIKELFKRSAMNVCFEWPSKYGQKLPQFLQTFLAKSKRSVKGLKDSHDTTTF